MSCENIIYLNGAFVPPEEAMVPVTERGFFGGDGIYEVTRTFATSCSAWTSISTGCSVP